MVGAATFQTIFPLLQGEFHKTKGLFCFFEKKYFEIYVSISM